MKRAKQAWGRIERGARGHPGNVTMVGALILGFAAGGLLGFAAFLIIYGPMWICGAWERGR